MNYSSFIVKVIQEPIQRSFKEEFFVTETIVKFPQIKDQKTIKTFRIFIWGNLGHDIIKYYQKNDYIIIEGYISLYLDSSQNNISGEDNKIQISTRKIYPFP